MTSVRPLAPDDRDAWLALWQGYLDFYEASLDRRIFENTWRQLLDPAEPMHGLVALDADRRVVGLLNYVLHANTWTDWPVCYLDDLFVDPEARGQGAGRALIEALIERARAAKWHRVYWMTKAGNRAARGLYDKIAPVTDWVRYDVNTAS